MRELRRHIFAFVLVAIYLSATVLSSLSLLVCDQHHVHHHVECAHTAEECDCHLVGVIAQDCCSHHHPILGENHTDFVVNKNRSDSRVLTPTTLTLTAIVVESLQSLAPIEEHLTSHKHLDESTPPRVALVACEALRAPPVVA